HGGGTGGGRAREPRRRGPHPRESRPCDRVRRRRARRDPRAIVAGRARSGERLAPGTAAPPRRRRLPHAPVLPPRGRRPGGAARAVRAILARRPGAPRTGRGARGVVHTGRVVGHRRRSGRDHQSGLHRRVVREWGYDYLRVDRLRWATLGTAHYGGLTHAEAYRAGLGAVRDGLGTEAFLLASEAPLQHAVGLVNGMRIGPDVDVSWSGIQSPARAAGLRSFYHRSTWLND